MAPILDSRDFMSKMSSSRSIVHKIRHLLRIAMMLMGQQCIILCIIKWMGIRSVYLD